MERVTEQMSGLLPQAIETGPFADPQFRPLIHPTVRLSSRLFLIFEKKMLFAEEDADYARLRRPEFVELGVDARLREFIRGLLSHLL